MLNVSNFKFEYLCENEFLRKIVQPVYQEPIWVDEEKHGKYLFFLLAIVKGWYKQIFTHKAFFLYKVHVTLSFCKLKQNSATVS